MPKIPTGFPDVQVTRPGTPQFGPDQSAQQLGQQVASGLASLGQQLKARQDANDDVKAYGLHEDFQQELSKSLWELQHSGLPASEQFEKLEETFARVQGRFEQHTQKLGPNGRARFAGLSSGTLIKARSTQFAHYQELIVGETVTLTQEASQAAVAKGAADAVAASRVVDTLEEPTETIDGLRELDPDGGERVTDAPVLDQDRVIAGKRKAGARRAERLALGEAARAIHAHWTNPSLIAAIGPVAAAKHEREQMEALMQTHLLLKVKDNPFAAYQLLQKGQFQVGKIISDEHGKVDVEFGPPNDPVAFERGLRGMITEELGLQSTLHNFNTAQKAAFDKANREGLTKQLAEKIFNGENIEPLLRDPQVLEVLGQEGIRFVNTLNRAKLSDRLTGVLDVDSQRMKRQWLGLLDEEHMDDANFDVFDDLIEMSAMVPQHKMDVFMAWRQMREQRQSKQAQEGKDHYQSAREVLDAFFPAPLLGDKIGERSAVDNDNLIAKGQLFQEVYGEKKPANITWQDWILNKLSVVIDAHTGAFDHLVNMKDKRLEKIHNRYLSQPDAMVAIDNDDTLGEGSKRIMKYFIGAIQRSAASRAKSAVGVANEANQSQEAQRNGMTMSTRPPTSRVDEQKALLEEITRERELLQKEREAYDRYRQQGRKP